MQKLEGLGSAEAQVPENAVSDSVQETFAEGSNPNVCSQPSSHFVCLKCLADFELNRDHLSLLLMMNRLKKIEKRAT